ncbi:MAG: multicopper oxidase domain-containing protein [Sulfuriferula sp.]
MFACAFLAIAVHERFRRGSYHRQKRWPGPFRAGNLVVTNPPLHLHGHTFEVTGTDGDWVPKSARWPEVTADVAVGQMRVIEMDFSKRACDWQGGRETDSTMVAF